MKALIKFGIFGTCILLVACQAGVTTVTNTNNYPAASAGTCVGNGDGNAALPGASGPNYIPMTIGTGLCGTAGPNIPCASVQICTPGTGTCQTISNLLVDTGSYGLRIFSSAITITPTQVTSLGHPLVECMYFGSAETWGPVQLVDAFLGSETKISNLPIQVINSSYAGSSNCQATAQTPLASSPASSGFNGILGVGLGTIDCPGCTTGPFNPGIYFSCNGSTCTDVAASSGNQVVNPVAMLSTDNNGVVFQMPTISSSGVTSTTGNLLLGVDTRANNVSSGATHTLFANANYFMRTTWAGTVYSEAFIDSGSNLFYMAPASQLPLAGDYTFAPSTKQCLSAVMQSALGNGSNQATVSFNVGNADNLVNTVGYGGFNDIGAAASGVFDWGLPFFYGRSVIVTIDGRSSSLGTGPLWGF